MNRSTSRPNTGVAARLRHREQTHRRAVLIGIGTLLFLSTTPVFGHHVATRAEVLLAGRDHLGNVCLIALHALLAPVHGAFHILLGVGLTYAVFRRIRAHIALRGAIKSLRIFNRTAVSDQLSVACRRLAIPAEHVHAVDGLPTPAFTAGWFRPRVYVAAALGDVLTQDELAAVIAHEAAHVSRRDPLRLSLLRFLADALFYIPALRRLADDMADEGEIAADDVAVRSRSINPLALASAIVRLSEWSSPHVARSLPEGAVGFQRPNLLERRVRRLIGDDVLVGTHVTRWSLSGAITCLALVWLSGLVMAHPLSAADGPMRHDSHQDVPGHCGHHNRLALSHIFCRGVSPESSSAHCPHIGQ